MKFEELPIYEAIYDVYREFEVQKLKPRSANHLIYKAKREELCRRITCKLNSEAHRFLKKTGDDDLQETLLKYWDAFGKSAGVTGKAGAKLTVEVAREYGKMCAYKGRFGNTCSNVITVDRIRPGDPYELRNCVIACSACNTKKADSALDSMIIKPKLQVIGA